jgi:pimeloyl-ACP methyl ester carboxylesterase
MIAALALWLTCLFVDTAHGVIQPTEWHWAAIHGHRIYYAVRGNGPTLVLLHGGGDSGEHSFVRQLNVFSERYHILAPDQVGQGHTPDVPGPLSYTAMMQDTAALLHLFKLKHVDVVGFSDGGILALMLAVRHPELVRRLVISGVNIAPEGLTAENLQGLRAAQTTKPKTIDEKLAHLWLTSPTETELSLALLAKITQPVLVISGDRDAITLEHTLQIFHALPKAELCVLPGTDHATFSGRSEWLNPIISAFLDRTQNTAAMVLVHPGASIQPMDSNTDKLRQLRSVSFHLKTEPQGTFQYGLIPEEVDKVHPELVIRDKAGKIEGVRYDELAPLLLNEVP